MEKKAYSSHRSAKNANPLSPGMQKLKNTLKFGRRWSSCPQKQLCFTWLSKILSKSDKFETTLDVACGNLNNYPFIKSPNYIGVDMNKASLDYGERVYPDARTELLHIEELDDAGLKGDLVLCTQTIGVNSYFNSDNTMPNIKTLVAAVNPKGTLVFDIGSQSIEYADEIERLLFDKFDDVEAKSFGSYDISTNMIFSIVIAAFMQFIPNMRISQNADRCFYVCENKSA